MDFEDCSVSVTALIPTRFCLHFWTSFSFDDFEIVPERCRYQVLSTKIEIRLFKAETIAWSSLEYCDKNALSKKIFTPSASNNQQKPSYPSSKGKVDWDKLEALVKKEEKEEKLEGDAALNKLFGDIYKDADEDTRRAMSKSFILAPLPIGFAVFLVHLTTIPITGTGINPARSLGAAIIYNKDHAWDDHWIFRVGPFVGAALAAMYHQIVIRAIPFKSRS